MILWQFIGHHKKVNINELSESRCCDALPPIEGGEEHLGDLERL